MPDGSYTQYTYYSDGKVNLAASPLSLSVDSRYLYTIEQHIYNSNAILNGYGDETPTYDVEQIIRYVVYTDEGTPTPYMHLIIARKKHIQMAMLRTMYMI